MKQQLQIARQKTIVKQARQSYDYAYRNLIKNNKGLDLMAVKSEKSRIAKLEKELKKELRKLEKMEREL